MDEIWTQDQRRTYDEMLAGATCHGCGQPILQPGPALELPAGHAECKASTWSVGGSASTHCSRCCPLPPLSPSTAREVANILRSGAKPR